jgi:NAD(P)-dependent dehydrogenase (short-subunit alcohol dehydrogenase family)
VRADVKAALDAYGAIDCFFNNAGIEGKWAHTAEYDEDMFDAVIGVNVKGGFLGLRHVLPVMLRQKRGAIVNTASVAGLVATPGMPADVEQMALGASGLIEGMRADTALFDMSTNSVAMVRKIHAAFAEKNLYMLDSPVSGGPSGAASGRMAIWVGGDEQIFNRHKSALDAMGDRFVGGGAPGRHRPGAHLRPARQPVPDRPARPGRFRIAPIAQGCRARGRSRTRGRGADAAGQPGL